MRHNPPRNRGEHHERSDRHRIRRPHADPFFDKPETITYNRFFQHSMAFLEKHDMLKDIVMTFGVSSSLYVATNAYGLKQGSFVSSAAWQCIGFETGAAAGAQLGRKYKARRVPF